MSNVYHAKDMTITINGEPIKHFKDANIDVCAPEAREIESVEVAPGITVSGTITGQLRWRGEFTRIYSKKKRIREKYKKRLALKLGLPYQYPRASHAKRIARWVREYFTEPTSDYFDSVAALYGLERKENESDDELRHRVLLIMRGGGDARIK